MEISSKAWSRMTKEEKQEAMKDIAKLRGYAKSWKEIAEYYSSVESTIKQAYNTFVKTTEKTERSCKEILNETSVNISDELITKLLERIESLELEVASVKKLQVENAAIERLDDTEYKYFIQKDDEVFKFREAIDVCMYLKDNGYLPFYNPIDEGNFLIRQLTGKSEYKIRDLIITQSLKNDTTNMRDDLTSALNQNVELRTELENFKKEI